MNGNCWAGQMGPAHTQTCWATAHCPYPDSDLT